MGDSPRVTRVSTRVSDLTSMDDCHSRPFSCEDGAPVGVTTELDYLMSINPAQTRTLSYAELQIYYGISREAIARFRLGLPPKKSAKRHMPPSWGGARLASKT